MISIAYRYRSMYVENWDSSLFTTMNRCDYCVLSLSLYMHAFHSFMFLSIAGWQWHIHLHSILEELGFQKNIASDISIFIKCHDGRDLLIILVYVNDITIFGTLEDIESFKTQIATCYKVTDLEKVSQFLRLHVACNHPKKILTIHQSHYIHRMLTWFNMLQCQLVYTPFAAGTKCWGIYA